MASRRRRRTDSENDSNPSTMEVSSSSSSSSSRALSNGTKEQHNATHSSSSASSVSRGNVDSRQDRTREFSNIIRSMIDSGRGKEQWSQKSTDKSLNRRNDFSFLAKKISQDLATVYSKLDKLTLLAKRRSIFDDKEAEVDQLTNIIRQDLGQLNQQISQLQELSRAQKMSTGHDKQTHASSVLVTLQSKLAGMTSDFRNVLHDRTETLQQQKNRRSEFSSSASGYASSSSNNMKWLLMDEMRNDVSIDMNNVQQDNGPRQQRQQQLQNTTDSFIQSRADTMRNIEQTIVELGSIYQQLAHMVQEQGEMVQRIDSHVEESVTNVELAHTEIVRYFQSVSSNRWLMLKIFAVLIVFFVIFVVFIS